MCLADRTAIGTREKFAFNTLFTPHQQVSPDLGLLSYLSDLTFDFEREGQRASAILIYAEPNLEVAGDYHSVVAAETGFEGVACLDDTARAAVLGLGVYEHSQSPDDLALAKRWLSFVEYMQYPNGQFANFIRNAAGIRNSGGQTPHRGGHWWSARALWALARAYRLTGNQRYLERYQACRLAPLSDGKINAILALGELELYAAEPSSDRARTILEYCATILRVRDSSPYLLDQPGIDLIHLWGYHQVHALATAARVLDHAELLPACAQTIATVIEPAIHARLWHAYPSRQKDGVTAYDVAPMVQGLSAMYRATGNTRYRELALQAALWFYGRNDAGAVMYDPATGRCRDGINDGQASLNCGAESSIEAGLAELERRRLLRA